MKNFEIRRDRLYDLMARENIALVMFEDAEGRRDPGVRWLTGQPGDALLFLTADRKSVLVPWDSNMARLYAQADHIIPYGEFDRQPVRALRAAAEYCKIPFGSRIEIPMNTPYLLFLKYVEEIGDLDVICRAGGIHDAVQELRAVKDEEEIRIYRKAVEITNGLIDLLETNIRSGTLKTEADAALFIEAEGRKQDCEGVGFETLAANPSRSFGIHAFPAYTGAPFLGQGFSILDFGLKYLGYSTDVTLTFARGRLSKAQEKTLELVEQAAGLALSLVKDGADPRAIAQAVDLYFGKNKRSMPHGLGHGIGLEAHETPFLRSRAESDMVLRPGMIFTIEPGLYDPLQGGCRLENDILLTEAGPEVLTASRIIRL
jgi:Xaa-Pro dipeptidase